jgi:hypothetical protein
MDAFLNLLYDVIKLLLVDVTDSRSKGFPLTDISKLYFFLASEILIDIVRSWFMNIDVYVELFLDVNVRIFRGDSVFHEVLRFSSFIL